MSQQHTHYQHDGECLCGAVSFKTNAKLQVGACHCNMCRQWGGGPFMAVDCGADVRFSGDNSIRIYSSSDWAERGFCLNCGSHLFYHLKQQDMYIIPVGLFSNLEGAELDHQVFIDEKPGFYCFAEKTRDMTGAELFAAFAGE